MCRVLHHMSLAQVIMLSLVSISSYHTGIFVMLPLY